ncbi:MAG TPA: hypothetical protein VNI84_13835 [Pyrinomonadaceae bacterium]|nr:hypothetical protein [Pyrinomonadaceae bacterium]
MAQIAKVGTPSLCSLLPNGADVLAGLAAGEDLGALDACHIAATGLVMKSNGAGAGATPTAAQTAAANAAAKVHGYAPKAVKSGQAVTLHKNIRAEYGANLTPGTSIYLSATAGTLSDVATTGGTAPIGFVVSATRVFLDVSRY